MKHCTEEELIEHYYGEGGHMCASHLEACGDCAETYAELQGTLAAIQPIEPPPRDADYGNRVWKSLAQSLPPSRPAKFMGHGAGWWRGLSYAAAGVLIVAGSFYAGRLWEHRKPPIETARASATTPPRVVVVVLGDHLDRSERLLVALKHVDAGSAEMVSPLRDEARSLLAANRVCLQNTDQEDDPALANTLDRLGRLLNEFVNQPGGLNPRTVARLQDEISAQGLLFEVRVLRSQIADQEEDEPARPEARHEGGSI
jgi:hypothetical protein